MSAGVSIADAARELGVAPVTVRRWIRIGAPTVSLGQEGRGNGSRVDVAQLRAWRTGGNDCRDDTAVLNALAAGLRVTFSTNVEGYRMPAHRIVGLRDPVAAMLYVAVFHHCAQQIIGHIPEGKALPREIRNLIEISKEKPITIDRFQ